MEVIVVPKGTDEKTVLVYDIHGERLENCSHRKARILRSEKKARVYCVSPFSIQLLNVSCRPKKEANASDEQV